MPQVLYFRDHGHLLRSTSVNVAVRIWCAMPRGQLAMIMAAAYVLDNRGHTVTPIATPTNTPGKPIKVGKSNLQEKQRSWRCRASLVEYRA